MSDKAKQFVDEWAETSIHPTGYQPEEDNSEAQSLAEQCRISAEAKGITLSEIEEAVGDLVDYMANTIERVNDAEVQRLSDKDG